MGEIAEMMLDGTMCGGCGEWLCDGEDGAGFPGLCSSCARGAMPAARPRHVSGKPLKCPACVKRFKTQAAIDQHRRDVKH